MKRERRAACCTVGRTTQTFRHTEKKEKEERGRSKNSCRGSFGCFLVVPFLFFSSLVSFSIAGWLLVFFFSGMIPSCPMRPMPLFSPHAHTRPLQWESGVAFFFVPLAYKQNKPLHNQSLPSINPNQKRRCIYVYLLPHAPANTPPPSLPLILHSRPQNCYTPPPTPTPPTYKTQTNHRATKHPQNTHLPCQTTPIPHPLTIAV